MNLTGWITGITIILFFAAVIVISFVRRSKAEKNTREEYKKSGSDHLIKTLSDKKSGTREQAAKILGENRERNAIHALVNVIYEEEDADLLIQAAEALIKINDESVIDILIDGVNYAGIGNKWYAGYIIQKLAEKGVKKFSAIEFLISVMAEKDKLLAMGLPYDSAYEALKKTTGEDLGKEASKWKDWWNLKSS
ncbi:HEAT repeat domain-containing protein [candidate division WOR-3 bacterium]|nr:HEAT repeat domain-containing protein [candidate division WOR-3 bacterium]